MTEEQKITFEGTLEATAAESVLNRILELKVGEVACFDPPLERPVVGILYLLLEKVDRAWLIYPPETPKLGFWEYLKEMMKMPLPFNEIPIAKIERTK